MRSGVNSKLITGTTVRRCMRAHNAQHLRQNEKDFCAQAPSWPCSKGCAHAIYKRVSFSDGAQFPASSPPVPRTVPATVPRCDLRGNRRLRQYAKNTCFGTITPLMYAVLVFSQITAGNCAGNCAGNWRGTGGELCPIRKRSTFLNCVRASLGTYASPWCRFGWDS